MAADDQFGIPFTVRVSPHLDQAREHHIAWLREHSLLTSTAQVQRYLTYRMSEAVACCYPDAGGADLAVATDFTGWARLFDDMLDAPGVNSVRTAEEARNRLLALSSKAPTVSGVSPCTPIETSFADMWSRVTEGMSPSWQQRFTRILDRFLAACCTETRNRQQHTQLTAEQYRTLRRDSVWCEGFFALIERTNRLEVPAQLFSTSQFTVVQNAGSDLVALLNDLYSFKVEESKGDCHNMVLITEKERGCSRDEAIAHVRQDIKDLTRQFLDGEGHLPALYRSLGLNAHQRLAAERYVEGMRNFVATTRDWSATSDRYSTEPGQ
ncbi:hypothetical protein I2W78_05625 [Streptomyces spinoverrucosus]|uniref:terpene synthase family protein n=1 Tax=Streptomyces spinoverrucosus TaxID=284043 RepID=UPI0018C3E56F|nr:hypothetical protein [Streptomyces spinoverrucosus]MBG0851347.1 hypothetical protein [Streptomyces spinoverrucosus]